MIDFIYLGDLDRSDDHLKEYAGKAIKICNQQQDENIQGTEAGLSLVTCWKMDATQSACRLWASGSKYCTRVSNVSGGTVVHVW